METRQPGKEPFGSSFFNSIRRSGWYRPDNSWMGGVCAGISVHTGLDVTLVRVLTVLLAIFAWPITLLYGIAWALLPDATGSIHTQRLFEGDPQAGMWGAVGMMVLGGFVGLPPVNYFGPLLRRLTNGGVPEVFNVLANLAFFFIPLLIVAIVVVLVLKGGKKNYKNPPPFLQNQSSSFYQADSPTAYQADSPAPDNSAFASPSGQTNPTFVGFSDQPPTQPSTTGGSPMNFSDPPSSVPYPPSSVPYQPEPKVVHKRPGPSRTVSLLTLAFILLMLAALLLFQGYYGNTTMTLLVPSLFLLAISVIGICLAAFGRRTGWIGGLATFTAILVVIPLSFFISIIPANFTSDLSHAFRDNSLPAPFGDYDLAPCENAYLGSGEITLDTRQWKPTPCHQVISDVAGEIDIHTMMGQNVIVKAKVRAGEIDADTIGNWLVTTEGGAEKSITSWPGSIPDHIGYDVHGKAVTRLHSQWNSQWGSLERDIVLRSSPQATESNSLVLDVNVGAGQITFVEHPNQNLFSGSISADGKYCINGYWDYRNGEYYGQIMPGLNPALVDWDCSSIMPPTQESPNPNAPEDQGDH